MNDHGITVENLLNALPPVLAADDDMKALAKSIAGVLVQNDEDIGNISIYPNLDNASEALCDILAKDFDVTWYNYDYDLSQKRSIIKSNFNVHRHLGTAGAVNDLVSAAFKEGAVQEWFDYGGEPYHFKIILKEGSDFVMTDDAISLFARLIENVKNVRSHLDDIEAHRAIKTNLIRVGAILAPAAQMTMDNDYKRDSEIYINERTLMACIGEGIGNLEANFGRDTAEKMSITKAFYGTILCNAASIVLQQGGNIDYDLYTDSVGQGAVMANSAEYRLEA